MTTTLTTSMVCRDESVPTSTSRRALPLRFVSLAALSVLRLIRLHAHTHPLLFFVLLVNKPQYAAFGAHKKDGVAIQAKQGEYDFLSAPIDERDQYEEDEEDESEYDEEQQVSRKRITRVEATAMALEMGRKRVRRCFAFQWLCARC